MDCLFWKYLRLNPLGCRTFLLHYDWLTSQESRMSMTGSEGLLFQSLPRGESASLPMSTESIQKPFQITSDPPSKSHILPLVKKNPNSIVGLQQQKVNWRKSTAPVVLSDPFPRTDQQHRKPASSFYLLEDDLVLSQHCLGDKACEDLSTRLSKSPKLRKLDLSVCTARTRASNANSLKLRQ